jgi:membrane-associated phospholipid phosphatase
MDFSAAPNIALQAHAPGLGIVMLLISLLGSAEFYLAIIPLVLWGYDRTLGLRLLLLCSASAAINAVLKLLFHSPRPYWISTEVRAFASEPTFGMPSAAAQVSLTFLGCIGAWFRKPRVWAACIALIILVGIARMYLGVHFLQDVLTGWVFALVILCVFLRYETAAATWILQKTVPARILLVLCASVLFIVASWIAIPGPGTWQVPAGWSALAFAQTGIAISPLAMRDTLLGAGLLFGAGAGAAISAEYIPWDVAGSMSQKALRCGCGILVLGILWITLGAWTKSSDLPGYGITWLRSALAGIWITAGAPLLFTKTRLVS